MPPPTMSPPNSLPAPSAQPGKADKPSSFGRRVAARVGNLIAKFEAMAMSPAPPSEPPRKRNLESVVGTDPAVKLSSRPGLRKSLSKKASRMFQKMEKENDLASASMPTVPEKVQPPKKKLLRPSRNLLFPPKASVTQITAPSSEHHSYPYMTRRGRRRATMPTGTPKQDPRKKRRTISGSSMVTVDEIAGPSLVAASEDVVLGTKVIKGASTSEHNIDTPVNLSQTISYPDNNSSGLKFAHIDGPVSQDGVSQVNSDVTEYTSAYTAFPSPNNSTPPVARILPSSFFVQLAEERVVKTPKPRIYTDSEDSSLIIVEKREKIDPTKFRLDPNMNKDKSAWKRKITPPRISVKELISKFKIEETVAEKYKEISPVIPQEPQFSSGPLKSKNWKSPEALVVEKKAPPIVALSQESLARLLEEVGQEEERPSIESIVSQSVQAPESVASDLLPTRLYCDNFSDASMSLKSVAITSGELSLVSQQLNQQSNLRKVSIVTDNGGLVMPTIPSAENWPQISSQPFGSPLKPTPYSAPIRVDTPPGRKYRKTPPPEGFFRAKTKPERYSTAPSLYTVTDDEPYDLTTEAESEVESEGELSGELEDESALFRSFKGAFGEQTEPEDDGNQSYHGSIRTSVSIDSSGSYRLTSESSGSGSGSESGSGSYGSSVLSGRITVSSRTGGIVVNAGIPAANIITPVPVNAVTTIAIQKMVERAERGFGIAAY